MPDDKRTQQASLGCGTLILIALIVLIFSGRGSDDLERQIGGLQSEISALKRSVETQTSEIRMLQQKLDKHQPTTAAVGN